MATAKKARKTRKGAESGDAPNIGDVESRLTPLQLLRSSVYRRLPPEVRHQVDEAILQRPAECPSLEKIAAKFELAQRYHVSVSALKRYAGKLEKLARPVVASHLMTHVIHCLPEANRADLIAGGEVMLLSRLFRKLIDKGKDDSDLSIADLAKLASILVSVVSKMTSAGGVPPGRGEKSGARQCCSGPVAYDENSLAQAVRSLYGLDWPSERARGASESKK
jgi:hypothetical protein